MEQKARDSQVKLAQQLLSKLSPVLRQLEATRSQERFDLVAPVIRTPMESGMDELTNLEAACNSVIAAGAGKLDYDVKALALLVARLRKEMSLATQIMATISKAA